MSGDKATSPCGKFQANIFNKSKCQNCFKSRELHLLGDRDMEQAKPVYGGWLCLAPEGTDFDNPMQRSRKWQRRFFVLYEDGSLSFALDELPSTLPQGTVNMNLCTDISDAEPRTGQKNAVCIVTPEQEIFIRGDNKEIISGWSEQLAVYPRTNKQNPKKKRKVEPVATQEPSPAKMAATDATFPASSQKTPQSACTQWQEELRGSGPGVAPMWSDGRPPGSGFPLPGEPPACLDLVASRNISNQRTEPSCRSPHRRHGSPSQRILGGEDVEAGSRKGRSEARTSKREKLQSCGDLAARLPAPQRRARSLDRRTSETFMTPDLLNFKKGWMVKLEGTDQWKKFWFVLSTDSLRYYKDSIAEEAAALEGEIDLSKCYHVSEYQVQRNYGFQIHTPNGVYTLSAMTSGIRKNWIQALMKNVHPGHAPNVASLPGHCGQSDSLPKPDVTPSAEVPAEPRPKHRSVTERRREGRYRTFDWAEFRPQTRAPRPDADPQKAKAPSTLELCDLERRKRREERRRRYESMLGISLSACVDPPTGGGLRALSPKRVEEEVEECWRLVEATVLRLDRSVPLLTEQPEPAGLEELLEVCRKEMDDLKARLEESECCRLELEARLRSARYFQQQEPSPSLNSDSCPDEVQLNSQSKATYEDGSLSQPLPSIWLQDTEGNLQQLRDSTSSSSSSSEEEASPLLSPASDLQEEVFQNQQVETTHSQYGSVTPEEHQEVRKLSLEVELLTSQNQALNQRNQEMLNQLTEADREIERLKAELSSRYSEPCRLPEEEEEEEDVEEEEEEEKSGCTKLEVLQEELSLRNQELLEAQALISALEENLRQTEAWLLQKAEGSRLKDLREEEDQLQCSEPSEESLSELERKLSQSQKSSEENLTEEVDLHRQAAADTEADVREVDGESEEEVEEQLGGGEDSVERIKEVIKGETTRLKVLEKLLELISKSDVCLKKKEEEQMTVEGQLRWEEEFWNSLRSSLEVQEEEPVGELAYQASGHMLARTQLLLGLSKSDEDPVTSKFDPDDPLIEVKRSQDVTQKKISWLEHLTVGDHAPLREKLRPVAERLSHPLGDLLSSAAAEAVSCCRLSRLQQLTSCLLQRLAGENEALRAKVQRLEDGQLQRLSLASVCCQTEEVHLSDGESQTDHGKPQDVLVLETQERHQVDVPPFVMDGLFGTEEPQRGEKDPVMVEVSALRRRVKELEEQLSVREEQLNEELDGKMRRVQAQHEQELEKLKVTCTHGFASMEDCHVKVVEELQRRHQQEVEHLLAERDRLLEEESAATATAIEAIKNAHRLELEREVQKRRQTEAKTGDARLEDVYRQHSEELISHQRELHVLSQQFSLRCLENGHLVQALDAERKALCQCQQENQDLRTRNQELSSHLAAEITRLCSLAKQDDLLLSQEMCVYEMEITLRVRESEVQCLKQENTSLKAELQSAQTDKRHATRKYKDALTELSITRAKADKELDELRENLRLAHCALDQTR